LQVANIQLTPAPGRAVKVGVAVIVLVRVGVRVGVMVGVLVGVEEVTGQ